MSERIEYLKKKRLEVLERIKPICDVFGIKDYDYIVKETGQTECLRLYDTYIGCSHNSIEATVEELIGYIFIKIYCKGRSIGAFRAQTLKQIRMYWLSEESIIRNYKEELKND